MIKKIKIFFVVIGIALTTVAFYAFDDDDNFEIAKNLDIFYTLFREVNLFYVDEVDAGDLMKKGIDAMLKSLDPYTNYIPESAIEDYKFMTTGQYGGIGALIRKSGDYIMITEPYEGFPAHLAGLKAGDVITKINDKSTHKKTSKQISDILKGQPDTELEITVTRFGHEQPLVIKLNRKEIKIGSVPYFGMINDEIGYVRLSRFTRGASKDVSDAVKELKSKNNAKSIILDLRGNPGGLLHEAVNISNIFIPKGEEIVSTKGKISQWDKVYTAMHQSVDDTIPVVVLVNRSSASASEIVSGAIQDLDRGIVIGERTFGKGLVQTTRKLSYNAQLKVTTAKYYIPSGRCIQALDYTHRNDDGSVGKVPDSLITKFQTRNGREVFDGGGVLPDIIVKPELMSNIAVSFIRKSTIFNYVTYFANNVDSIDVPEKFVFTDDNFKQFKLYIDTIDIDYVSASRDELDKLIGVCKKEKYYDLVSAEMEQLKTKLERNKEKDLETFKEEITELITEEIASRYYYQKGRLRAMLLSDPIIKEAKEVLSEREKYNAILDGTYEKEKNDKK